MKNKGKEAGNKVREEENNMQEEGNNMKEAGNNLKEAGNTQVVGGDGTRFYCEYRDGKGVVCGRGYPKKGTLYRHQRDKHGASHKRKSRSKAHSGAGQVSSPPQSPPNKADEMVVEKSGGGVDYQWLGQSDGGVGTARWHDKHFDEVGEPSQPQQQEQEQQTLPPLAETGEEMDLLDELESWGHAELSPVWGVMTTRQNV